jgi:hypothetical protein
LNKAAPSETLLYWLLIGALLCFSVYTYALPVFPAFNYTKDVLVVLVFAVTLIDAAVQRPLHGRVTWIDIFVFLLLVYLIAQLIYTAVRIDSLGVAYLGFRLDWSPIAFYFALRRLRTSRRIHSIHALVIKILIVAVCVTLFEFSMVVSGLIPQDVFWRLVGANEAREAQVVGWIPRVYGMIGTPQITGVFHVVLLALLLFWPRGGAAHPGLGWLDRTWVRSGLILLTLTAIFLSTSKTAWLLVPVVVGLDVIAHRRLSGRVIRRVLAVTAASAVLLYVLVYRSSGQQERVVNELILGTLLLKQQQVAFWTADVLHDYPWVGYGYAYDVAYAQSVAPRWTAENGFSSGDFYAVDIVRMFGVAGASLILVTLGILPLRVMFSRHRLSEQRGAALAVVAVFGAFAHYSPLTHPLMGLTLWYLLTVAASTRASPPVRLQGAARPILDAVSPYSIA